MKFLFSAFALVSLMACATETKSVAFYENGDQYLSTEQLETYGPFVITLSNGAKIRVVTATNSVKAGANCVIDIRSLETMMLANWSVFKTNTAPVAMQSVVRDNSVYCVGPGLGCLVEVATLPTN